MKMGAARRVEWQIGRLLPKQKRGSNGHFTASLASETGLSIDDAYQFRQIGTLDLDWEGAGVTE